MKNKIDSRNKRALKKPINRTTLYVLLAAAFALIMLAVFMPELFDIPDNINTSATSEISLTNASENVASVAEITAEKLTVRVLDVGQGDCTLINLPDGDSILIDAGVNTDKTPVLEGLKKYMTGKLRYAFFTHPHADHIGAASDVINKYVPDNVVLPNAESTSSTYEKMIAALEKNESVKVIMAKSGLRYSVGGVSFEILSPIKETYETLNEYSIALRMSYGDFTMMFMGDCETSNEKEIMSKYSDLACNVVKLGHHGSSSSSSRAFLKALSPEYAIMSLGAGNPYGHPHRETVESLEKLGISYFRTDTVGTITIVTDGVKYKISKEK